MLSRSDAQMDMASSDKFNFYQKNRRWPDMAVGQGYPSGREAAPILLLAASKRAEKLTPCRFIAIIHNIISPG